jgi:hypothetical protein
MIDDLSIWAMNVLLQVTIASGLGLTIAACFRRNSAAKYWILCSALVLMLISPLLVIASQRSGWNLVSVGGDTRRGGSRRLATDGARDSGDERAR